MISFNINKNDLAFIVEAIKFCNHLEEESIAMGYGSESAAFEHEEVLKVLQRKLNKLEGNKNVTK